jgi:hypothetical protein
MGRVLKTIAPIGALLLLLCMAALPSCNNLGCLDNRSSIPLAGFYASNTDPVSSIAIDSISVYGLHQPADSMLLDSATAVSRLYLPLRSTDNSTQYVIRYLQHDLSSARYNDTITFVYQSYPYFESIDCGAMYRYRIDTCMYTRNILDSVGMVRTEIDNKEFESIRIFYVVQLEE